MDEVPFRLESGQAWDLADRFGTPLYVLDEATIRSRARAYRESFKSASPGSILSYASKANSTLAVIEILHQEGFTIDVASEGELEAALRAGVPAAECHLHGNAKSNALLDRALEEGIGKIVVDSLTEAQQLADRKSKFKNTKLLLRLNPSVRPETHEKISTGHEDTKFGLSILDGSAERALKVMFRAGLPIVGLHGHVGSQLLDPEAQVDAAIRMAEFGTAMAEKIGFDFQILNLGGGLGVAYAGDPQPLSIAEYCRQLVGAVRARVPDSIQLQQEPGRSLVADAGVTIYRVETIKEVGGVPFVSVDGGLSDNPRPALYGANYRTDWFRASNYAYVTDGPGAVSFDLDGVRMAEVYGAHCEVDHLFSNVEMPVAAAEGDLLVALSTGAYNASMASNYNRFARPATVLLRPDGPVLVQERENWDTIFARERRIGPTG
jgi:diaminopimelate decarboxylase